MYPLWPSKNYNIAMITSKFYSNFILYSFVLFRTAFSPWTSCIRFSLNGLGMGKVCFAWMKIIWPLLVRRRVTCKTCVRQLKATSHELGSIVKLASFYELSLHFKFTHSCQILVTMFINPIQARGLSEGTPQTFSSITLRAFEPILWNLVTFVEFNMKSGEF